MPRQPEPRPGRHRHPLARLARDSSGNTLALVAAAIAPILAMVGGAIDIGRGYMSETRLQQACDAGVLAARKKLGSEAVLTGDIPAEVGTTGQRFFNINFRDGSYGTRGRSFRMDLEDDYSISGAAAVTVPTTIMAIFGFTEMAVQVECQARLNFANTDIMMVLDTTGSMNQTNPGDTVSRITALRATILRFYQQLAAATKPGTRVRYGFVPYSVNVNVGHLLKDEWVVDDWTYQSRQPGAGGSLGGAGTFTFFTATLPVSGTIAESIDSTYPATLAPDGSYACPTRPANTVTSTTVLTNTSTQTVVGPPAGTSVTNTYQRTRNGNAYSVSLQGSTCTVRKTAYLDYVVSYQQITEPSLSAAGTWDYAPLARSTANRRTESNGCIEERATYEIDDYANVDLTRALDLDIDRIPTAGDAETQWRPQYPATIYARQLRWDGSGSLSTAAINTADEYVAPALSGMANCPAPATKLQTYSLSAMTSQVSSLVAGGSTYHDIGMIWGGRLLSPTGIFADENGDVSPADPTSRNLIFFTDGQTAPLDLSYSSYGLEPLDRRRWSPGSGRTLTDTINQRFAVACREVKKRNITVWLVAFGTEVNPIMAECAGPGRYFSAADSTQLDQAFAKIAQGIGDLRIVR